MIDGVCGQHIADIGKRQTDPASASGEACTRTAGCWPPPTKTWPTPDTCEIFCAKMLLAVSKPAQVAAFPMSKTESESAHRTDSLCQSAACWGRFAGRSPEAALIAAHHITRRRIDIAIRSNCNVSDVCQMSLPM